MRAITLSTRFPVSYTHLDVYKRQSEVTDALRGISSALGGDLKPPTFGAEPWTPPNEAEPEDSPFAETTLQDPREALREAREEAARTSSEACLLYTSRCV